MKQNFPGTLFYISAFAIAMGMLESAVVIYLRDILYPEGFDFPLNPVRPDLVWTEIGRELATLVMLLTLGILTGRTLAERFAWFLYAFAVWDIFYYIFLWILIGWPESIMTWDVLFLLPVTWTGPVLSPLIVACTMIVFALMILLKSREEPVSERPLRISGLIWLLLISGSLILITAFTWDYSGFVLDKMSLGDIWTLPKSQVHAMVHEYIPEKFNWWLFSIGEIVVLSGIFVFWRTSGSRDS
jgi:hypothetical protein